MRTTRGSALTGLPVRLRGSCHCSFFFQAEDGIRDLTVTGVQTCALPICLRSCDAPGTRAIFVRRPAPAMVAVQRAVSAKDPDMKNIDELKSTGLKATLPRLKILEIFQTGAQRHMTAEDVFRVLLDERSDIGLATVYRVLTQFEQAGILIRSNFESGKAVYELNEGQHHDHFVCTSRSEEHTSELQSQSNLVC